MSFTRSTSRSSPSEATSSPDFSATPSATGPTETSRTLGESIGLAPELLLKLPVFAGLGFDQAGLLARQGHRLRLQRGQHIIEQDQVGHALHVLLAGSAQVLRSCGGEREVILARVAAGDFLGEMSLIDGLPHSATVRCEQVCDVLVIEGAAIARCLPLRPILAYAMMFQLSQRLRGAHRQIVSLALFDVHDRVMRCLFDLAQPDAQQRQMVRQPPQRQDMAKMVGASREMVSRVMRELETSGRATPLPDGSLWLHGSCPQ